jgi:hypothetical protein
VLGFTGARRSGQCCDLLALLPVRTEAEWPDCVCKQTLRSWVSIQSGAPTHLCVTVRVAVITVSFGFAVRLTFHVLPSMKGTCSALRRNNYDWVSVMCIQSRFFAVWLLDKRCKYAMFRLSLAGGSFSQTTAVIWLGWETDRQINSIMILVCLKICSTSEVWFAPSLSDVINNSWLFTGRWYLRVPQAFKFIAYGVRLYVLCGSHRKEKSFHECR